MPVKASASSRVEKHLVRNVKHEPKHRSEEEMKQQSMQARVILDVRGVAGCDKAERHQTVNGNRVCSEPAHVVPPTYCQFCSYRDQHGLSRPAFVLGR